MKVMVLILFLFTIFPNTIVFSDNDIHEFKTTVSDSVTKIEKIKTLATPQDLYCLTANIYFESAQETVLGKLAVAQVVLNRVSNVRFPNNICDVIKQGPTHANGLPIKYKCAFSWYCDGKSDIPTLDKQWYISKIIAETAINHHNKIPDVTYGATHYHAVYVSPYWNKYFIKTNQIGRHIFYR